MRPLLDFSDHSQDASGSLSSRRDFLRFALAASSLPLLPDLGFASMFADERTAWYRAAKFACVDGVKPNALCGDPAGDKLFRCRWVCNPTVMASQDSYAR